MKEKRRAYHEEALRIIFRSGSIERNVLAQKLRLSPIIVAQILQKLIQQEKIKIIGKGKSSGGRKPEVFSLNPQWGKVIALTFTSQGIQSAGANPQAALENVQAYEFSPDFSRSQTLDVIYRAISEQIIYLHKQNQQIFRIGIAISGQVDERLGISLNFPRYEQWQDVPLRSLMEKKFSLPISVANHVTATTLAENLLGKYTETKDVLYFHLGHGLGLGIIAGGEVYRGSRLNVGEFGHTTVGSENNWICYCGSYGCLEGIASAEAIQRQFVQALREGAGSSLLAQNLRPEEKGLEKVGFQLTSNKPSVGEIFKAAASGDRLAYQIVARAARYLGTGIANMVNIFSPQLIILGGMMAEESDLLIDLVKQNLKARALQKIGEELEVVRSSFGKNEGIMGAACLAWTDFLKGPKTIDYD